MPFFVNRVHRGNKKIVKVEFTNDLIDATLACIRKAHEVNHVEIPAPLQIQKM